MKLYNKDELAKRKDNANKARKFTNFILALIFIPLLIINVILITNLFLNPHETPSLFGIKSYVIVSGSMTPNINVGDIVFSKEVDKEELKEGDVISFKRSNNVITHRIVRINYNQNNEMMITTKGDNNNSEDSESVTFESIEGKVIGRIPKLGNVALFISNKVIIIIIIILFYFFCTNQLKNKKKKANRRIKRLEYEEKKKGE